MLRDMRELAAELKGFERSDSFKVYGFSLGGPHHGWLDRAKELQRLHENRGLLILGDIASDNPVLPNEITELGISNVYCASTTHCSRERIASIEKRLARMRCR